MNVAGMPVLSAQTTSSTGTVKVLINRKCDSKLTISRKEKAFNGGDNSVNYYIQSFLNFVGMSVLTFLRFLYNTVTIYNKQLQNDKSVPFVKQSHHK